MSPLADDQIRAALARRVQGGLTEVERANILRAARLQALQPRRRLLPRLAGWLAATAAVVILVVIAVPILLSSPVPVARASSSPAPTPAVATHIYSAQELSDMIGSSAWIGRTVLARGSVSAQPTVTLGCEPPSPCPEAVLDLVTGENSVTVSWRDAPYLLGRSYQDDSGTHWAQLLDVPTSPGVFAFTVGRDSVELLGPAQVAADGQPLNLADIPLDSEKMPTGNVYVVSGWWYSGFWPPCPVPGEALQTPQPELDYFCQGSWITASPPQNTQMTTMIEGALQLPSGPYPPWSDGTSPGKPVQGIYVVRSAGCQIVLEGNCPVWRLLGRLDDTSNPASTPTAIPTGQATPARPSPSAVSISSPRDLGLDQAIEVARQNIGTDYELWGYAAGTYADVLRVTGTYGSLVPPRGATWDTWVWAIVFSRPIEVCPPVQGASCDADVQLSTVYIDFRTGSILDTVDASAVPAESLPSPFFVLPPQGSPKPQGS